MKESEFQSKTISRIKREFDGCMVLKNDAGYLQGVPDVLVLYNDRWAALEFKKNTNAPKRPNQDYYIHKMNDMSFAAFVCPENLEEVFYGLQETFRSGR